MSIAIKVHPNKLKKGDIILYDDQEHVIEHIYKVQAPGFVTHGDTRWVLRPLKGGSRTETGLAMDPGYGGKVASQDLRLQLIKLGSTHPELRPHIRPVLAAVNTDKQASRDTPLKTCIWV